MKKPLKIGSLLFLVSLILPSISFAFSLAQSGTTFSTVITYIMEIIKLLIPILVGVAFIVFFWGLSKFILNSNKPEEIKNGRNKMMWGILMLFILITFNAIIGLVATELEIKIIPDVSNVLPTDAVAPK